MVIAATVRLDLTFQLVVTLFLGVLFWLLYLRFLRVRFFGHWTIAWFAFSVFLAGAIAHGLLSATLWRRLIDGIGMTGGYLQIACLFSGVESFRSAGGDEPRRLRWCVAAGLLAGAMGLSILLAAAPGSLVRQFPSFLRQLGLVVIYAYVAAIFLSRWQASRSLSPLLTALGCLVLGAHQLMYLTVGIGELHHFFSPQWFSMLGYEASTLVDIAGDLCVALGMVLLLVDQYQDAEHRRRTDKRSRRVAETRYHTLVEQLAAVTYIARPGADGQWIFVSPQIQTMLGYSPQEWLADSSRWFRLLHPDDRDAVLTGDDAAKANRPFNAEYRIYSREGRIVWVHDTAVLVPDPNTDEPLLHGVMIDISEKKEMESRLLQSQKMEAIGKLAGGVAHDFNNILTVIKGYTDVLLERSEGLGNMRSSIEAIRQAEVRAEKLTQQLLAFSRKQVLQPRNISLNDVIRGVEPMLRRLISEDVETSILPASDLGTVRADPGQIEQIVVNLAVNARDAMPRGGKLTLETANVNFSEPHLHKHGVMPHGRYVLLTVRDTGVGMDEDTLARIFEPFFTTKEMGKGTGLGLATVYGIVKQSGGYVWVYSEPGHGTSFEIYFPLVDSPIERLERPMLSRVATRRSGTILLVEDDPQVRELAALILREGGFSVLVAKDAAEMEAHCSGNGQIDLLLTDVIIPGSGGAELARRASRRFPGIKIVFMSGYTDNAMVHHGILEPGTILLEKPFTPTMLIAKISEVLA